MDDALLWNRLHFAFTVIYHYLFPQLTMGLAPFLLFWKIQAIRTGDARYDQAVRFWSRIFGINFAIGVVTGVPMEFQFGTNWSAFTRHAANIIGQTLAMEGMFAFFLESAFIGAMIWGEKRLGPKAHLLAVLGVFLGSWLSGYFILTTNAFMQHPVGYEVTPSGVLALADLWAYLGNPWAIVMYAHNMTAAVVTGSFVVAAVGAFYALRKEHSQQARLYLAWGTAIGLLASVIVAFPTGDRQAKLVAHHQPVALAAMEGRFESGPMADITLIGQPNLREQRLDNPIKLPGMLSFLAYGSFHTDVPGLKAFPRDTWPTEIEILYYAFHVMAGLGTLFIGLMGLVNLQRFRRKDGLWNCRPLLWALMLAFPFPYIATTAGWMTAELGRQPWLIFGLYRTAEGQSAHVSSGDTLFTLIGYCGLYLVIGVLFLFMLVRELLHGPHGGAHASTLRQEASHG